MEYDYEAVDAGGRIVKGRIEAGDAMEAVRRLGGEGHTVLHVGERRASALPKFRRRLRMADIVIAFHELATLLESGVALGDAIRAQSRGSRHPALAAAFEAAGAELMRGASFLEALRGSGLPLPGYVFHLVEAGELSGRLPQSLREAVGQLEYDQRVAADMRSALFYPAILVVSGIAVVALVFTLVVPQFANLLEDSDDLPLISTAVLRLGVWFNANAHLLAGALLAAAALLASAWRRRGFRQRLADGIAKLPVIGAWFTEADTAKWASVMAAMLHARVELLQALALALRGVRISRRRAALERAMADVKAGNPLSAALEKQRALTPSGYNLIRVGEQSGQFAQMLRALATLYADNSSRRMARALTLIEPLAILLIGGTLGTIMLGIILAMTSVHDAI